MKTIKNIIKQGIMLLCLMAFFSCEDYLNQSSPDKTTTDQVWNSYDAAESYLVSAYTYIQTSGWAYHEYQYLPQNFRADDLQPEIGTTAWGYLARIVQFNNTASSGVPDYLWENWYKGVKLSNDIIANVPNMDMISDEEKDMLLGEAYFLRGFYFLNLQMNFHNIILPLDAATSPSDLQIGISSREDVFARIIADLTSAAEKLPTEQYTGDMWGRANANAAYAFLGKACLYAGKHQEAIDAFKKISGRSLVDAAQYRSLFDGSLEENSEVIFSRGYTPEQQDILYMYHQLGVAFAPGSLNGGWEMVSVSDYYMSQLENGDIREAASVLLNGETFDGETINFTNPNYKMLIKYVESLAAISSNRSVVDIILMRYADVLLMQAEANYVLGNTDEALKDIKKIRARAGLPNLDFSGEALLEEIRKQRLIELIGEGSRFYDLVRWGIAAEQLSAAGHPFASNFETKHGYFPIPLSETQRNGLVSPTPGF